MLNREKENIKINEIIKMRDVLTLTAKIQEDELLHYMAINEKYHKGMYGDD